MFYDQLKLEKGMYNVTGKTFSEVLEEMDNSAQYEKSEFAGLDAFQRQLKRFDIRVGGGRSDCVAKFFQTSQSAALFPEYIARAVRQGVSENRVLPQIIASKTMIDSLDYRTIYSAPKEGDKELKLVAEGALIPRTVIKTKENLVKLNKRGRMLEASYEAVKFQRLDLFTVALRQIGEYIAKSQLKDALDVLLNGDGNNNAAQTFNISGEALAYSDLIKLWSAFDEFELNAMVASNDAVIAMIGVEEFKNPQTGINFAGTGSLNTPLGAALYKTSVAPQGTIIGLDKRYALEMVCAGEVMVEYDKLIDRQLERAAISSIAGFSKIYDEASKVLKI